MNGGAWSNLSDRAFASMAKTRPAVKRMFHLTFNPLPLPGGPCDFLSVRRGAIPAWARPPTMTFGSGSRMKGVAILAM